MPSLTLLLALGAMEAHAADASRRYALLVGANDGGPDRTTLRYAHRDAQAMSDVLVELGGVDIGDRTLLLDPDATTLDAALSGLADRLEGDESRAEVIFYYSGHSDEEGLMLGDDYFAYRQLRERLDELPADVRVAILDSCASGAMIRSKGGSRVAPFLVDESNNVGGFAYITSSAADEVAQEADRIGGSYFTHYLASGLRGAADLSQDGRVTLDEAYAFAYQETLARTERTQHGPQHANRANNLSGEGNLVLTDLQLTTASLVLDELLDGRALIRDNDGDLVAELLKPEGRAIELGLGAGQYQVTLTVPGSDSYAVADVTLTAGASTLLDERDLVWFDAELAVARGDGDPPQAAVLNAPEVRRLGPRLEIVPGVPGAHGRDTLLIGLAGARSDQLEGFAGAMAAIVVTGPSNGISAAMGFVSSAALDGAQLSMGANVAGGDARGLQGTMGLNVSGGMRGVQSSMGANIARGDVVGLQFTLGYNHATDDLKGAQASLGVNVAQGTAEGLQGTLGVNVAKELKGVQASLGANVAQKVEGTQLSVGANVAGDVDGAQVAHVNVGHDVDGAQVGFVNVAHDVKGTQIGLINVANDIDGLAVGLLTFEKQGRHDLLFYASESDLANVDFKLGGDHLYTVMALGAQPNRHAYVGLGYGGHANLSQALWLDLDAMWQSYVPLKTTTQIFQGQEVEFLGPFDRPPTQVVRTRATLGLQIAKQLAAFGGVSMAVRLPLSRPQLDIMPGLYPNQPDREVIGWPGLFAGVQF